MKLHDTLIAVTATAANADFLITTDIPVVKTAGWAVVETYLGRKFENFVLESLPSCSMRVLAELFHASYTTIRITVLGTVPWSIQASTMI